VVAVVVASVAASAVAAAAAAAENIASQEAVSCPQVKIAGFAELFAARPGQQACPRRLKKLQAQE
jgi:hypothetical protein